MKATDDELLRYVNREHGSRAQSTRGRYQVAAFELMEREQQATRDAIRVATALMNEEQYGYIPREKPDDCYRLMYENWNSLGVFTGTGKIGKVDRLLKQYQVNTLAGCETQADWRQADHDHQFGNLFAFGQKNKTVVGHNTTEQTVRDQKGGTAMGTFGRLSAHVLESGVDETGLGRWCWQLIGKGDVKTRVVVAYQPCEPKGQTKGFTVYEQHQRYFQARGDFRSPRTIFYEQLVTQLLLWKAEGNEIILCGDFNENVYTGRIAQRLGHSDLVMREQCQLHTGKHLPPTFITGTRPIDAVFATTGVEVVHAALLGKYGGVGDHRCFILDFTSRSTIGSVFPRVLPAAGRNLNCDYERIVDSYNSVLNQLCSRHRMYRRLDQLTKLADVMDPQEFQIKINKWDDELTDYMRAAESRCRKFKHTHIEWSPLVGVWLRRKRLLWRIGRYLDGKVPDARNLVRDCTKRGIVLAEMTAEDLQVETFICNKQLGELKAKAPQMRQQHLRERLANAVAAENENAAREIRRIIQREDSRKKWGRIRYSTKKSQGGAVYSVRVEENGLNQEYGTQGGIFTQVSKHLSERFRLAFRAGSYSGKLFDDVGFLGDTAAAQAILEGTYDYPPDTDPATKLLFEEASCIYKSMSQEQVATYVTAEDFQYYWQRANERISSSYSGLHFGHYKAASFNPRLFKLHADKLSLCARQGIPLARWGRGLTVLLEKICGNNYVHRLRAICLFEADFNWWNKLIFARRMMKHAGDKNAIPDELFAKSGSKCIDDVMCKTFFADISKVQHHPASIGACDLDQCYDSTAHPPTSLGLQAWGIPKPAVRVMLQSFSTMQFCLRTGFGESDEFFGGTEDNPIGGYGQGSGAAPPAISCFSTLLVNTYKRMGNGAKLTSSYACRMFLLAAAMYVDDSDLLHLADSPYSSDEELIEKVQSATDDFANVARATGGSMKPTKCSVYFMSYKATGGKMKLKKRSELSEPSAMIEVKKKDNTVVWEPSHVSIPHDDGSRAPIPTIDVSTATEMLGVFFAPAGNGIPHIKAMRKKGITWADRLTTRPLPSKDVWESFMYQLYPGMSYGLASAVLSPAKLDELMQSLYYKILPLLGVNRCITKEWRTMLEGFQGLGLPDFVVDCLAAKLYFLLSNWGFESTAGVMMQHAYEAFLVESGLYGNLLTHDYTRLGCLATSGTWFKNLWEFTNTLGVSVDLGDTLQFGPVRDGDKSLMELFYGADFSGTILERLNRVRHVKGVVHLSDCLSCDGRTLEPTMLDDTPGDSVGHIFPRQEPTRSDFYLWAACLRTLFLPSLRLDAPLGPYLREGHLKMRWRLSADDSSLYFLNSDGPLDSYEVFERQPSRYPTRYGRRYRWVETIEGTPQSTMYASIRIVNDNTVSLHSTAAMPISPAPNVDFWHVLHSFPNQSLWRYFHCDGDGSWIHNGLLMGSLVVVHDGSYMPEVDKQVCSAGFMFYCRNTGQMAKGSVVEHSTGADNYRGELLGGLMVQLVLKAATQHQHSHYAPIRIDCDNQGVVKHGNAPTHSLKEKQPQADVLRVMKQLISSSPLEVDYQWVPSHQDTVKKWTQLSLREKMNVVVDRLAKLALWAGVANNEYISSDFPFESMRINVGNNKVVGSTRHALSRHVGQCMAQGFYHDQKIIHRDDFDLVMWDAVESAMRTYPKEFRKYVTKHVSKFCGTNRQLHRIISKNDKVPTVENVRPSCGREDESSSHITRCRDPGRRKMLEHSIADIVTWMQSTGIGSALTTAVCLYLELQGSAPMQDCIPSTASASLLSLAAAQDRLGWDNFVGGLICKDYLVVAQHQLKQGRRRKSPFNWCRDLMIVFLFAVA